jgi:hypothetical protein
MRRRGTNSLRPVAAAVLVLLVACTSSSSSSGGPSTPPGTLPPSPTSTPTGSTSPGATLADGTPLPEGCDIHRLRATQTVAFASGGRVWALDPNDGRLTCLLEASDPGPFLWGPLGDRVLLGGFQVVGFGSSPSYTLASADERTADWGHPIGIAIVFAEHDASVPEKFLLENHEVQRLSDMPHGTYLDVAYHPSGLALAWVIDHGGQQEIWFSTNEGTDPKRLVFGVGGTTFSDVGFSHDGQDLVYTANHPNGYADFHSIDLSDPGVLHTEWHGGKGDVLRNALLSPSDQRVVATIGASCDEGRAVQLVHGRKTIDPLPDVPGPTSALGWIDAHTYLVGAGGCGGEPTDVYAASTKHGVEPNLLVSGVDAAASRAAAPPAPTSLPKEVQLDTGSGVG